MIDINKMKKADKGSITTGTIPTGNGRLKKNLNVPPVSNILVDTSERNTVLKKEEKADICGFKGSFTNRDAIPPAKSKKTPAKNIATISSFGGILK